MQCCVSKPDKHNYKGSYCPAGKYESGPFCFLGALHFAQCGAANSESGDPVVFIQARDALINRIGQNIIDWNDAADRTQAEVVAAMRAAARC